MCGVLMLDSYFFDTARRNPTADALWVDGRSSTYQQLSVRARHIADALRALAAEQDATANWEGRAALPRCLLFAHRS